MAIPHKDLSLVDLLEMSPFKKFDTSLVKTSLAVTSTVDEGPLWFRHLLPAVRCAEELAREDPKFRLTFELLPDQIRLRVDYDGVVLSRFLLHSYFGSGLNLLERLVRSIHHDCRQAYLLKMT